jgi:hypothetical protein
MTRAVKDACAVPKLVAAASVLVSLVLFARPLDSQAPAGLPVHMVITAEPTSGVELPPIAQHDVIVSQGPNRRPVIGWTRLIGAHAGLQLAILIDDSSDTRLGVQLPDIRTFINEQPSATEIGVGYMQNGTVNMAQDFTKDHAAAAKALRLPQGFGGANASPYFSLSELIKQWGNNPSVPRREVLMITSGIDEYYGGGFPEDPYVEQAIHDAQCAGVVVFSLYAPGAGPLARRSWRVYWGQNYLSELSEETGGESYYFLGPQAPVSFAPYLDTLARQLNQQFLLTFLAEPRAKAGREPVRITSELHKVDLSGASQVCVPASPDG